MRTRFSIGKTQDEFGHDRYFVTDDNGDWVEGPFDTYDAALEGVPEDEEVSA